MTFLFIAAQRWQLDLPVGLTDLRHSFASGGQGLPMIGKLLGHTQQLRLHCWMSPTFDYGFYQLPSKLGSSNKPTEPR